MNKKTGRLICPEENLLVATDMVLQIVMLL